MGTSSEIPKIDDPFEPRTVEEATIKVALQSSPGPSGIRHSHPQAVLDEDLVGDITHLSTTVSPGSTLLPLFWALHTGAKLSALDAKARPSACGEGFRTVMGTLLQRVRQWTALELLRTHLEDRMV